MWRDGILIGEEKAFLASSGAEMNEPPSLNPDIIITNLILGTLTCATPCNIPPLTKIAKLFYLSFSHFFTIIFLKKYLFWIKNETQTCKANLSLHSRKSSCYHSPLHSKN